MEAYRDLRNLFFAERTIPLHAMLINAGRECVTASAYRWDGRQRGSREFVIWQYTLAGEGELEYCGEVRRLRPGDAMLLVVPERHCYYLPPASPGWEFCFLTMSGAEVVRLARECRRFCGPVMRLAADSALPALAEQMFRRSADPGGMGRFAASELAYGFMMQVAAECGAGGGDQSLGHRIGEYCLRRIDREITVDELARQAGLSRWHFSRVFREQQGISPRQFVIKQKMRFAMRLLQTSGWSLKEIAAACGFADAGYFGKVFRREFRMTPGEFRHAPGRADGTDQRER